MSDVFPALNPNVIPRKRGFSSLENELPDRSNSTRKRHKTLDSNSEDDSCIAKDINNPEIYTTVVLKCDVSKNGKRKKSDRVYNSRHICPFCELKKTNFSHHILSKQHETEDAVKQIKSEVDDKRRKQMIAKLRLKAAHKNNVKVQKDGKGEVFLMRRSSDIEDEEDGSNWTFDLSKYGPCPNCFGWVQLKWLKRHMHSCAESELCSQSSTSLIVQSNVLAEKISEEATKPLIKEVFPIMQIDTVTRVAQSDKLIIALGNQWMMRCRGNEIMRKYYTSSVMRLSAKLKLACQQITKATDDMDAHLVPGRFDTVVNAALLCCNVQDMDDEDLKSPSNAIKLGYDIKRMASVKMGTAIKDEDEKKEKEAKKFLKLMDIEWHLKVTRLARAILTTRSFNRFNQLPLPSDVTKIADYLQAKILQLDLTDICYTNFRNAAILTLARLTLFNRRRCHEVQALR